MSVRATLFVFDVGHGDHLLLRIEGGPKPFHAVIDCNWPRRDAPIPALAQLAEWGVEELDLLVLTHPHKDHFMGLAGIAEHFTRPGRRLRRYSDFGLDLRLVARRLNRGSPAQHELLRLWDATIGRKMRGLPDPLYFPIIGPVPAKPVAPGATFAAIAPRVEAWTEEDAKLREARTFSPNRVSSVLVWRIVATTVLCCGDLEAPDWKRILEANDGEDLRAEIVKVGHHGAATSNPPEVWTRLARPETQAAISTRGTEKHPSSETLHLLVRAGVLPRCTNYGPLCEPHVPGAKRSAAVASLGARARRTDREWAIDRAGLRRVGDRRCFGTVRFDLGPDGRVATTSAIAGARCHLRESILSSLER